MAMYTRELVNDTVEYAKNFAAWAKFFLNTSYLFFMNSQTVHEATVSSRTCLLYVHELYYNDCCENEAED